MWHEVCCRSACSARASSASPFAKASKGVTGERCRTNVAAWSVHLCCSQHGNCRALTRPARARPGAGRAGGVRCRCVDHGRPDPGRSENHCLRVARGERRYCPATTSAGVALVRTAGTGPCLLGKTCGYDDGGIWTSDGCSGEFIAGQVAEEPTTPKPFEHIPNIGFLLYGGEKGQVYFRLFSYARYLNQRNIAASYTDFFGVEHALQQRQGHPAGEVLRAVQRMVLNAEVPVRPLRLVVECVARGSSTGRRRRQSELHVQSLHLGRCRHHLADDRPQHGSPDFPI